ncbi:hypothetical protein HanXRQr2_Chr13g0616171 [Helianthus annuus]|uniref:Uncharacterized protein n=1 Tax=Helianthus annuus TaxID=4232 RepID=A0A9K3ENB7_HELAN|nr:hypothetical protein HanXRQr2_Chr13g0616171 [Helianthus annuus]
MVNSEQVKWELCVCVCDRDLNELMSAQKQRLVVYIEFWLVVIKKKTTCLFTREGVGSH